MEIYKIIVFTDIINSSRLFLNKNKNIVIADVRFKHEIEYLKNLNFNIIKINRKDSLMDNHVSEKQNDLYYDYLIENNNSKEALFNKYEDFI
jgi:hypothetical protein